MENEYGVAADVGCTLKVLVLHPLLKAALPLEESVELDFVFEAADVAEAAEGT